MPPSLLIRGARQLLTLDGKAPRRGAQLSDIRVVQDGSVLVIGEHVYAVGSARQVDNLKLARGAQEVDASGKLVMPGFVDSHTHFLFPASRLGDFERRIKGASYLDIAADGGGILSTVRAFRLATAQGLARIGERWLRRFAACGTTTVEGKSGYGLALQPETKALRVMRKLDGRPVTVVPTFLGAHAVPPEFESDPEQYVDEIVQRILPEVRAKRLAEFCDAFCDQGAFDAAQCRRVLEAARSLGLGRKLHADQLSRRAGVQLALELGAASVDHLELLEGDDLHRLAASETVATLLPGSVFHLGRDRYAPARRLIDAGAIVALATDFNPGTSPTVNMQMILALACSHMRMSPAEAIGAATVNGAAALGIAGVTGSLAPDKFADIAIFDVPDYRELPYYFGMNLCWMTIRRGRIVWRAGDPPVEQEEAPG